jgi:hypothetical protein
MWEHPDLPGASALAILLVAALMSVVIVVQQGDLMRTRRHDPAV